MPGEYFVNNNSLQCSFPADLAEVEKVLEHLGSILPAGKDKKVYFNTCLVLREALNNAIIHGACQDPSLEIFCHIRLEQDRMHLMVHSPGPGFDWQQCLNKDLSECPSQHGWGVYLIQKYTQGLRFSDQGRRLECWMDLNSGSDNPC